MQKKKTSNNYFNEETQQAIIDYNNSTCSTTRAKLFSDKIYIPFYKLAENIIHTFKFYYTDTDDIEDLKHTIITVLLQDKIHKFDPSKGAKAYSYFGTIVKRWLINYNNENYKKLKRSENIEVSTEDFEEIDVDILDQKLELSKFIDFYIQYVYNNFDILFESEKDKKIADSILTIFKERESLEIFKKKALYIYIREITDCKTSHLTKVVKILKDTFYHLYNKKLTDGVTFIR